MLKPRTTSASATWSLDSFGVRRIALGVAVASALVGQLLAASPAAAATVNADGNSWSFAVVADGNSWSYASPAGNSWSYASMDGSSWSNVTIDGNSWSAAAD